MSKVPGVSQDVQTHSPSADNPKSTTGYITQRNAKCYEMK